ARTAERNSATATSTSAPPSGAPTARRTSPTGQTACSNKPSAAAPAYTNGGRTIPRFAASGTVPVSSVSRRSARAAARPTRKHGVDAVAGEGADRSLGAHAAWPSRGVGLHGGQSASSSALDQLGVIGLISWKSLPSGSASVAIQPGFPSIWYG